MEMTSNDKGAIAEQAIVLAATKLGVRILRPVAEHGRTDLVFDIGGELLRVQVKWGRLSPERDVVIVSLLTSRCTPRGHVRSTYREGEVDLFAIYSGELDRCFLLPGQPLASRKAVHLRVTPARNRQQSCINLADDFDFDGAIAQLGERCHGMAEVAGSSPASSTGSPSELPPPTTTGALSVAADAFRVQLGRWLDRVAAGQEILITRRGRPMARVIPP
jgi:prevent-host-death family protein